MRKNDIKCCGVVRYIWCLLVSICARPFFSSYFYRKIYSSNCIWQYSALRNALPILSTESIAFLDTKRVYSFRPIIEFFLRILNSCWCGQKKRFSIKKLMCFLFFPGTQIVQFLMPKIRKHLLNWSRNEFFFNIQNKKLILQTTNSISSANASLFGVKHIPEYPCQLQKFIFPKKLQNVFKSYFHLLGGDHILFDGCLQVHAWVKPHIPGKIWTNISSRHR